MARITRTPGIEVEQFVTIDDPNHQGTHDTWWGVARMHVKAEDALSPHMLTNELICSRLAASLGLPVLPGEIATGPEQVRCWVTPQIAAGGIPPPPTDARELALSNPNSAAAILVFDSWVRNQDRTADNILHDPRLGLWVIDHEDALAGAASDGFASLRQGREAPVTSHVFRDEPLDEDAVVFWTRQVQCVTTAAIDRALEEAHDRGLVTQPQVTALKRFLLVRRDTIGKLLPTVTNMATRRLSGPAGSTEGLF